MTYRERRLRKAERLRGWAEGRDAKAAVALDGVPGYALTNLSGNIARQRKRLEGLAS